MVEYHQHYYSAPRFFLARALVHGEQKWQPLEKWFWEPKKPQTVERGAGEAGAWGWAISALHEDSHFLPPQKTKRDASHKTCFSFFLGPAIRFLSFFS